MPGWLRLTPSTPKTSAWCSRGTASTRAHTRAQKDIEHRQECEHLFQKFRQVDSSNTRAKGGTGLGLAIAREIIEMHGGRIWVELRLGQGSTFRMELPVRAAIAAGAA